MRNAFFFTCALTVSSVGYPGDFAGNGADNVPEHGGAAWFLGASPVRYCFEVSKDFGLGDAEVAPILDQVISQWRDYIAQKRINDPEATGERYNVADGPTPALLPALKARIFFNVQAMKRCDGTEDLKFYFGTTDATVRRHIKGFFKPTAFAQQTHWDSKKGWSKGFVWIASPKTRFPDSKFGPGGLDWTRPFVLQGILLHEMGHILGCSHVARTIMDESMGELVRYEWKDQPEKAKALFTRIDQGREVYVCKVCDFKYSGNAPGYRNGNTAAFKALTGKEPRGRVDLMIENKVTLPHKNSVVLTVSDSTGAYALPVDVPSFFWGVSFDETHRVFKKSMGPKGFDYAVSLTSGGVVSFGQIRLPGGKNQSVVVSRNNDYNAVEVTFSSGADRQTVFGSGIEYSGP